MKGKTGRTLAASQVVDIFLNDIYAAYVREVHDGGLVDMATGRKQPGRILLQIMLPMACDDIAPVYIIRDAPKSDDAPADPPKDEGLVM